MLGVERAEYAQMRQDAWQNQREGGDNKAERGIRCPCSGPAVLLEADLTWIEFSWENKGEKEKR